jgi:hypothetical protein
MWESVDREGSDPPERRKACSGWGSARSRDGAKDGKGYSKRGDGSKGVLRTFVVGGCSGSMVFVRGRRRDGTREGG